MRTHANTCEQLRTTCMASCACACNCLLPCTAARPRARRAQAGTWDTRRRALSSTSRPTAEVLLGLDNLRHPRQRMHIMAGSEVRVRTGGGSAPARTSTLSTPGSQGGTSYGADSASARSASTAASRSAPLPPASPALGGVAHERDAKALTLQRWDGTKARPARPAARPECGATLTAELAAAPACHQPLGAAG